MHLTPREIDKILLHNAGCIAQKRYARGIMLNYPEAIALISSQLLEFIREGISVADLMNRGKQILGVDDVMSGVEKMIDEVQVEGTFPDGTKLVTVHQPICNRNLQTNWALYGSGLEKAGSIIEVDNVSSVSPGKLQAGEGVIILNENRKTINLDVINRGDRPVQVGSHYNFIETNAALEFDRKASLGFRLNIPAGTAIRFEPGEHKNVELVEISGTREIFGGNGVVNGSVEAITETIIDSRMEEVTLANQE